MVSKYQEAPNTIKWTNSTGSDVSVDDIVVVNGRVFVACVDIANGSSGTLACRGVFSVTKLAGAAWTQFERIYYDETNSRFTDVADNNVFAGLACYAALSAATTGYVLLAEEAPADALTRAITDPGDAGAIPNSGSGHVDIVTAAAETRTLADPAKGGLLLLLAMQTDGGDAVVTAASAVNAATNTIMTFAEVTASVLLLSVPNGAGWVWRIIGNDGVALS